MAHLNFGVVTLLALAACVVCSTDQARLQAQAEATAVISDSDSVAELLKQFYVPGFGPTRSLYSGYLSAGYSPYSSLLTGYGHRGWPSSGLYGSGAYSGYGYRGWPSSGLWGGFSASSPLSYVGSDLYRFGGLGYPYSSGYGNLFSGFGSYGWDGLYNTYNNRWPWGKGTYSNSYPSYGSRWYEPYFNGYSYNHIGRGRGRYNYNNGYYGTARGQRNYFNYNYGRYNGYGSSNGGYGRYGRSNGFDFGYNGYNGYNRYGYGLGGLGYGRYNGYNSLSSGLGWGGLYGSFRYPSYGTSYLPRPSYFW